MDYLKKYDPLKNKVLQILDKDGKIVNPTMVPNLKNKDLIEAYKIMNLSRRQDDFQNKAQRQGRLLSFLSSTGQEACEVGYTIALKKGLDWFASGYRNNAAWLTMGMPIHKIMMYWMGNEFGGQSPEGVNSLPPNIIIGSQYSQAVGIAYAEKLRKGKGVAVTTTGDGGSSEGETYEAMNFAVLHNLPVVFIIENNKYAISTPVRLATKSMNFAVKGIATGMPSIKVDGNDFLASYKASADAIEYARKGNGPILIEFDTYRMGAHSSSDNPDVYRPKGEYEEMVKFDPLVRMKKYLISLNIWDEKKQEQLDKEQSDLVRSEFDLAEKKKAYPLEDIFKYTYEKMTDDLNDQLAEAKEFIDKYPQVLKGGH
ncbi:pyruvate dehydrogenase E1 component subunit alpha [Spiroplasma sp. TIUS-1]|uniref:pyruvate dehydrogenase (acetyl-transferring) E1 component subunit alpha n=1 Tax=Spiroplasma sp. TIUS-1 TaxID=216963 RepID=UPI001397D187|nr:pyruvate dehydrogenase (acetyl-transferring) E1 component subunit alpha [Spiroplasma sp. TIUS-1]QHX35655.1 pyruvate dehydrogenase E1 component subunit alpha [Spiroplasma sp. TIUS-1]